MAIIPLLASFGITWLVITNQKSIESFSLFEWVTFYVLSTVTMALAITPTTFIAILSGYFLGFDGLIPIVLSYQIASLLGYFLARNTDNRFIDTIKEKYPKSNRYFENIDRNQIKLTFLSRISPTLPFAIMNVVLAVSKVRVSPFLWGGLVGMLPRTLFFLWVGHQAANLQSAFSQNDGILLFVSISALTLFAIYRMIRP